MRLVCVTGPPRVVRPQAGADPLDAALGAICDDLLTALGGRWDDPPAPPEGWHTDPALEPLRGRAAAALAGREDAVWEDPRAAFLLPFWDTVAEVAATAVVVLPPDDVVHHLVDAAGLEVEDAARLWLRSTVTAWCDAPTRVAIAPGHLRHDPVRGLARIAELVDDCYDDAATRAAIARCVQRDVDVALDPSPTVGGVVGGPVLGLARAVHDLLAGADEAQADPVLRALRAGWVAERRADRAGHDLATALRTVEEELDRSRRLEEEAAGLRAALAEVEQRWAGAARQATVGEEELARRNQQLTAQLHQVQRRLEEVAREYDRFRRRRAVRAAVALESVAKPALDRLRRGRGAPRGAPAAADGAERPPARVATVLLNYRHTDDTLRCLRSLQASTERDQFLVVVDNGSGRDALDALREGLGGRTLIDAGDNLGYAAGNNLGIRHALDRGADYVWILNPDTRVEPDTLARLLDTMAEEPDCGILGARILTGDSDPVTIQSDGGIVDAGGAGATSHRDAGRPAAEVPATEPHAVDYVTGACMLVRRAVFDAVGLLPEEWFLYFEETDFDLRAADVGWRVLVDPRAVVWHHKRSSGRVPSPYYVYYFVRNRLRFASRYGTDGEVPADLAAWIDAWRGKVEAADPSWTATFDDLVERALADARAGVTGRRPDIEDVAASELSRG